MFSIVLVCLGVFQEYIMTNIAQLVKLGHTKIYVLTNAELIPHFEPFSNLVTLVPVESLNDSFDFRRHSTQDKDYRGGFWHHTSARFFVLYEFMAKTGTQNVIHIENDVLLYYNCDHVLTAPLKNVTGICVPFDCYERSISSILYISDARSFAKILVNYDYGQNDMYNFSEIQKKTYLVGHFPIYMDEHGGGVRGFVSTGWSRFGGYIFDAAAIGQYIGGVDPRNRPGDSRGFVNETCVIKYADEGAIVWKNVDDMCRPFLRMDVDIPIFNLHIHSKELALYT